MKRQKIRKRKKLVKILLAFFILIGFYLILISYLSHSTKTVVINPLSLKNTKQFDKLSQILTAKNIAFLRIEQESDLSYKISIKDNGVVFISDKKDLSGQIDSLQLILNRLTIEGKRFKILDFRFDKPVISY